MLSPHPPPSGPGPAGSPLSLFRAPSPPGTAGRNPSGARGPRGARACGPRLPRPLPPRPPAPPSSRPPPAPRSTPRPAGGNGLRIAGRNPSGERHWCCAPRTPPGTAAVTAGCRPCGAQLRIISSFFLLLSIRVARVKCRGRREAEACLCWGRRGRSRCRLHWGDEACHRCTNALSCASGQMAPGPGSLLRGVRDGGHCKVDLTRHGAA